MAVNHSFSTDDYIKGVLNSDRMIIGRVITLIESNSPSHIDKAQAVLRELLPHSGNSTRIGITGMPGAGKSTFIDTLGCYLTGKGHKVAVMAVDPSSSITRGSILGDKTRMEKLAADPNAFIRPSPSGGILGGVARKTRETMIIFEAAGYDALIIETIGVGQNEITVRSMVDFILLLMIAGAGDELQGIKKGIIEIADAIVINKADGDNITKALTARDDYNRALHYLSPSSDDWFTKAFTCSSITGDGVPDIWLVIEKFKDITQKSGAWKKQRQFQARDWLHSLIEEHLHNLFRHHKGVNSILSQVEADVITGKLPVTTAAKMLIDKFEE
ncbi:MAG: methylmalonyl Co-A mutase-associated GTPase MeaB [candidate division Zixibacteria bacterium]|nr:methylmalonyl Co-A mutase-associated GTPase MeaB [candidate division Zixibacteria bacterium]